MSDGSHSTYVRRREEVRSLLRAHELDVLLIYASQKNCSFCQWATGTRPRIFHYYFVTDVSSGFLAIDYHAESLRLLTTEPVSPIIEDLIDRDLASFLQPYRRVGLAGAAPFTHLQSALSEKEIVVLDGAFHRMILRKSDTEIEGIRRSAAIVKNVLVQAEQWVQPGISEEELARELRMALLARAEDLSFPLTVLSGPRLVSATAGAPGSRRIAEQDLVCIDAGVVADGFASDMTRMYPIRHPEAEERYRLLRESHDAVISRLRVDLPIRTVVNLYQEELGKRGLPAETLQIGDLGHSIGFQVHEYPFLYRPEYDSYAFVDGMVFTLEPEIVFPDTRMRVEDMVLMNERGTEKLT